MKKSKGCTKWNLENVVLNCSSGCTVRVMPCANNATRARYTTLRWLSRVSHVSCLLKSRTCMSRPLPLVLRPVPARPSLIKHLVLYNISLRLKSASAWWIYSIKQNSSVACMLEGNAIDCGPSLVFFLFRKIPMSEIVLKFNKWHFIQA